MKLVSFVKVLAAAIASISFCSSSWAQADEARAKKIISGSCFLCHGAEGDSSSEVFPRLAGQHSEYIAKQLENFKSGKRNSTAMRDMVAKLTPDEMLAVGKYFEKQSSQLQKVKISNTSYSELPYEPEVTKYKVISNIKLGGKTKDYIGYRVESEIDPDYILLFLKGENTG